MCKLSYYFFLFHNTMINNTVIVGVNFFLLNISIKFNLKKIKNKVLGGGGGRVAGGMRNTSWVSILNHNLCLSNRYSLILTSYWGISIRNMIKTRWVTVISQLKLTSANFLVIQTIVKPVVWQDWTSNTYWGCDEKGKIIQT